MMRHTNPPRQAVPLYAHSVSCEASSPPPAVPNVHRMPRFRHGQPCAHYVVPLGLSTSLWSRSWVVEYSVHRCRSFLEYWSDLLAVDQLGHGCAAVATRREISSNGTPLSESKETKL